MRNIVIDLTLREFNWTFFGNIGVIIHPRLYQLDTSLTLFLLKAFHRCLNMEKRKRKTSAKSPKTQKVFCLPQFVSITGI